MKNKFTLAASIIALFLGANAPTTIGDTQPTPGPGEAVLVNGLVQDGAGCRGTVDLEHAPLQTDPIGRFIIKITEGCGVDWYWQQAEPAIIYGQMTYDGVTGQYDSPASGSFLNLTGEFSHTPNGCPQPVAAVSSQSPQFTPGYPGPLDNPTPQPSTEPLGNTCVAAWSQSWHGPTGEPYSIRVLQKRVGSLAFDYSYKCKPDLRTMVADRLLCDSWPTSVTKPGKPGSLYNWGDEDRIIHVNPGVEYLADMSTQW